jgi:putative ABC transport system permease protein
MFRAAKSFDGFAGFLPPYLPSKTEPHARGLWGEDTPVVEAPCSGELFQVLQVNPILGRAIQPGDDHSRVAVLAEHYWKQHYGARPDVLGKTLAVDSFGFRMDYTIAGVIPDWVEFPYPLVAQIPDFWVSTYFVENSLHPGSGAWVIAHLKPGVSLRQAQSEVDTITARIRADHPTEYGQARVEVVSLRSELSHDVRGILWILLIALVFVLLIGCANVLNLLLVRALTREKEMALRSALGANRLALIRQLLIEAALLAIGGGISGLLVAYWGLRAFFGFLPASMYVPRFQEVALDPGCLALRRQCRSR